MFSFEVLIDAISRIPACSVSVATVTEVWGFSDSGCWLGVLGLTQKGLIVC